MADSNDNKTTNRPTLTLKPNTLQLTKTVESGKIKQSFQHGRSKTVTVEVKKTRSFARNTESGRMVEVPRGAAETGGLSRDELEARMKALKSADQVSSNKPDVEAILADALREEREKQAQEEAERQERLKKAAEEAGKTVEQVEQEEATERRDASGRLGVTRPLKNLDNITAAPAAAAPAAEKTTVIRRKKEDEPEAAKPAKVRKSDHRRREGKLTVVQALSGAEEERVRSLASIKRARQKAKKPLEPKNFEKQVREVVVPESITVQELANRMAVRSFEVVKELMKLGITASASDTLDQDTAELVITELGHTMKRVSESDVENVLMEAQEDSEESLQPRPPVVTIMGHVDHGKTSLLDALRETNVTESEAGGITQHIGAYQVETGDGHKVTFIDTPGHAAFTAMRARGAKLTDIVVLVVAADDGVMEQTREAISHAKAAGVPIIVAINKMDKPDAQPDRVKNELMQFELVAEDFGGDIMTVEVSALQKLNLDKLLEAITLQAEIMELTANPSRKASGVVVEAELDKGRGSVATLLIQRGTLKRGDIVVAGNVFGRVRGMSDFQGKPVKDALPSMPVEVLGLNETPNAGDEFTVVDSEKIAREIIEYRIKRERDLKADAAAARSVENMFKNVGKDVKQLPLVLKADVQGSAEAIQASLAHIIHDEAEINLLYQAVGAITESDVALAQASGATILAFNVRANKQAKDLAEKEGVTIRYYSVIYELLDDVKAAMSGMLSPEVSEKFTGYAEIREVFNITKAGKVAGCYVTDGYINRGSKVRLLRDNVVIHEGTLKTLKRFKDDVKEVKSGYECGMAFENYDDIRAGDVIEAFELQETERTL